MFIEPNEWLSKNSLDTFHNISKDNHVDLILCDCFFYNENHGLFDSNTQKIPYNKLFNYSEVNHKFIFENISYCGKFIKKSIITKFLKMGTATFSEVFLTLVGFFESENMYYLDNSYYNKHLNLINENDMSISCENIKTVQYLIEYFLDNTTILKSYAKNIFQLIFEIIKNSFLKTNDRKKTFEEIKNLFDYMLSVNLMDTFKVNINSENLKFISFIEHSSNYDNYKENITKQEHLLGKNYLFSIIVTAHNSEKENIIRLFNSIKNQNINFENIELIFIDDCSDYKEGIYLIEYLSDIYPNVKYVHLEKNGGVGNARNIGIRKSTSPYIMFLDDDDYYYNDKSCSLLYNMIIKEDVDIVGGNYYDLNNNSDRKNKWKAIGLEDKVNKINSIKENMAFFKVGPSIWSRIYKKNFLLKNNLNFTKFAVGEDYLFFHKSLIKADGIIFINEPIIYYEINNNKNSLFKSISLNNSYKNLKELIEVYSISYNIFKDNYPDYIHIPISSIGYWSNRLFSSMLTEEELKSLCECSRELVKLFLNNKNIRPRKDYLPFYRYITKNKYNKAYEEYLKYNKNKPLADYIEDELLKKSDIFDENKGTFLFSIIIPFFNSENYIKTSIMSIINQSLNFKENTEIILINDGSTDLSKKIVETFVIKFPNNIKLLEQNHSGQSIARNYGLKYAHGKYITFLDSDDYLSNNTLKEVDKFFNEHETNIISIPIHYFGNKTGEHELNYKFKENKVIDLKNSYDYPQLSIPSTFIRKEALKGHEFSEKLMVSEDSLFINQMLINNQNIGLLNIPTYYFRIKENEENKEISNNFPLDKYYFTDRLNNFHIYLIKSILEKENTIPLFIQNSLLIDLLTILKKEKIEYFETTNDLNLFEEKIRYILNYIDSNIIKNNKLIKATSLKKFLLKLKFGSTYNFTNDYLIHETNEENILLDKITYHKIWIDNLETNSDNIIISCFLNSSFEKDLITLDAIYIDENESIKTVKGIKSYSKYPNNKYIYKTFEYINSFIITIPIKNIKDKKVSIVANYHKDRNTDNYDENNTVSYNLECCLHKDANISNENNIYINNSLKIKFEDNCFKISNGYLFSIIMTVYNTEKYLEKSIESVINQSLDFEKNVQLILVNDGSIDNSLDILKRYKEEYPENIIVLDLSHSGQSLARNYGLKFAKGKYINFLDSDDYLSEDTLKEVNKFFDEHERETDIVSIPIEYFEAKTGSHELNYKFKENKIVNLLENPNYIQNSVSSIFININSLKNLKFNEKLKSSEDISLIYNILLNKKQYGLLNTVTYYYRKRNDKSAITDKLIFDKNYYLEHVNNLHLKMINQCLEKYNRVPAFIQYVILDDMKNLIRNYDMKIFDTEKNYEDYIKSIKTVMKNINDKIINYDEDNEDHLLRTFLLFLKYDEKVINTTPTTNNIYLKCGNHTIDNIKRHKIWITELKSMEDTLLISGFFNSIFDPEFFTVDIKKTNKIDDSCTDIHSNGYENNFIVQDTHYLSIAWQKMINFKYEIPIETNENSEIKINVNYHKNGDLKDYSHSNIISNNIQLKIKNKQYEKLIYGDSLYDNNKEIKLNNNIISITRSYKFSIIIAVYNTEKYLEDTILSIINQTMDFEKNIQLILVNDGSTDDSEKILLEYQKKYPDNIIVISQENQGQANARNNGLNHAKGIFINFLDSDDILSENTLSDVYKFFIENYSKTDIVSIPIYYFERFSGSHALNDKFEKTRVINLNKEPNVLQLSMSSSFVKKESMLSFKFPTNIAGSEDTNVLNKILQNKKTLGVVNSAEYQYRKRFDESSSLDNNKFKKEYYTPRLKYHFMDLIDFYLTKEDKIPIFIQYMLAYNIQWLLKEPDLYPYETQSEINEFWFYLKNVIRYISPNAIIHNKHIKSKEVKSFFLHLKNNKITPIIKEDNVILKINKLIMDNFEKHKMWIDIVEIRNNYLNISGSFTSLFNYDYITITGLKEYDNDYTELIKTKKVKYTARPGIRYLSNQWQYSNNFDMKIPLKQKESFKLNIFVNYHIDGNPENYDESNLISIKHKIDFRKHTKLSKISNYRINENYIIYFNDDIFYVTPYSYIDMIKKEFNVIKRLNKNKYEGCGTATIIRLIHLIMYPMMKRSKPIYLFMDRKNHADDNAEHLFKYALKQKDNIKKYYIIDKKSNEGKRISKIGKTIQINSFKHKLIYTFADKIISSQPDHISINPFFIKKNEIELYAGLDQTNTYYIRHGVTKDNLSLWIKKFSLNLSLVLTSSDLERNSFLEEGYNFDEHNVQALGLPRFDNLTNSTPKKQILFAPTWRSKLNNDEKLFVHSEYYNDLNNILNDDKFHKYLKDNGFKFIFRPHPELIKYIELMKINENIYVSTEESYQQLFKEASILITDYSSVFFDFAYLKKPVIYYQPTEDYHFKKGYFDYVTMGFGLVTRNKEKLFDKVKFYINHDCNMELEYKENVDKFFKYNDSNNCQRVYDWIKNNK
ncbi:hypothetical protein AW729_03885 [Methanosphaera sp. BMS]|nr:hypothetical protein AW729_03885 [Methanosphaera sp. BMS]